MKKYAYATFVQGESYLKPSLALLSSYKKNKMKYPFYLFYVENQVEEKIELKYFKEIENLNINIYIIKIPTMYFNEKQQDWYFNCTIGKFEIFKLEQYDKIIFLDSDVIILENIDFLFEKYGNFAAPVYDIFSRENSLLKHYYIGFIFLIKPSKKLYQYIHNNSIQWHDDEEVLYDFFYAPFKNDKEKLNEFLLLNQKNNINDFLVYHDQGMPKYWNLFPIDKIKTIIFENDNKLLENILNQYAIFAQKWK